MSQIRKNVVTLGEQRVAVLLVNFQDKPGDQPWSLQQAHDLVFGGVDAYYRETSSQRTWLAGDVYGWYTLPLNQPTDSTNCKLTDISQAAQQAASNAGVNLSGYDRLVYVFPQTRCFASGTGTVGGTPSEAWINGNSFTLKTVGHELGHNLGLYHSGALDCGSSTEGSTCNVNPYGDNVDIMGNLSTGHFNAHQKERLGWLDAGAGEIAQGGDGSYTLSPLELANGSGAQALKVLAHSNATAGTDTWYYIEYRQAIGQDSFIGEGVYASYGNMLNGVLVRQVTTGGSSPVSSLLLDMTPNSSSYADWYDAALEYGRSYTDPVSGLTLSAVSSDGSTATVSIGNGTASCVRGQPELRLLSAQSQWARAGSTLQYRFELVNRDSSSCGDSGFSLGASAPAGWYSGLDQSYPQLAPGASTVVTLTVSSAANAGAGYYDITVNVQHDGAALSDSAVVTYVVEAPEPEPEPAPANQAPVAIDDSAVMSTVSAITIRVLDNDWDPDGDAVAVISAEQGSKGSVTVNADGSITYTPGKRFKNGDSFSYTISDGQQSATATVSISVSGGSTGNTGGGSTGGGGKGGGKKN